MPRALIDLMHALHDRWRDAATSDFLLLGIAIAVGGWLVARTTPDQP